MGISIDGQICYGIVFDDEYEEFPWEEYDLEDWWLEQCGFKPPIEIYTDDGEYVNGICPDQEVIDEYYRYGREFKKNNPMPIEMVNACSSDYPVWIMAVSGTIMGASWGYPEAFDPEKLIVTEAQKKDLIDFCNKYGIDITDKEPKWYLSSYKG